MRCSRPWVDKEGGGDALHFRVLHPNLIWQGLDLLSILFFWQFASYSKFVPGEHRHVYLTLCSWLPRRQTARIVGHHLSNSDFQLANVDFGKITRWGPTISLKCFMYPSKEMVCKVLPRPCYNKKKLVNVFKACWWISPRAYFAFFFSKKKGKILSITDCPNKFLMGTQDTQKKKWC